MPLFQLLENFITKKKKNRFLKTPNFFPQLKAVETRSLKLLSQQNQFSYLLFFFIVNEIIVNIRSKISSFFLFTFFPRYIKKVLKKKKERHRKKLWVEFNYPLPPFASPCSSHGPSSTSARCLLPSLLFVSFSDLSKDFQRGKNGIWVCNAYTLLERECYASVLYMQGEIGSQRRWPIILILKKKILKKRRKIHQNDVVLMFAFLSACCIGYFFIFFFSRFSMGPRMRNCT